jgi:hypothetical protein
VAKRDDVPVNPYEPSPNSLLRPVFGDGHHPIAGFFHLEPMERKVKTPPFDLKVLWSKQG